MNWEKPSKVFPLLMELGTAPENLLSQLRDRIPIMGFCSFLSMCLRNRRHTGGPGLTS